jgi:U2-associated protein SR140
MSVSALAAAETGGEYNDPHTTNVHVYPLPAGISEQELGHLFARYGSVGTVKIMWPREEAFASLPGTVKRTKAAGLGGFVAMMERRPAEKAYKDLDGYEWEGATLRTTWGKSVPLPYRAAFGACWP